MICLQYLSTSLTMNNNTNITGDLMVQEPSRLVCPPHHAQQWITTRCVILLRQDGLAFCQAFSPLHPSNLLNIFNKVN